MRTIVHLSDLHFGRVNPAIVQPLLSFIKTAKPDLVAISGDLTQRARTAEFQAAREFLDAIPFAQIVVPGNHDVPLYNVLSRFVHRLDRYRRYITEDLAPFYVDDEIAVAGVNTARAFTFKDGRINVAQIAELQSRFQKLTGEQTKIVVTHHPFDLPAGAEDGHVVGRAHRAMMVLARCRVDLLLAGHFHIAHTGSSTTRFHIPGYSALVVASGTTTSTRGRGQPNSLNVIRTNGARIGIECWAWQPEQAQFNRMSDETYERTPDGWTAAT
ncbi:MAG: metallophosphoesterase [Chthoniobacterales bacterium]